MRGKIFLTVISVLGMLVLLLTSCGGKTPAEQVPLTSASGSVVTTATSATTQNPNANAPKYGGSITLAPASITEQFDPSNPISPMDAILHFNVYENLTVADWARANAGSDEYHLEEVIASKYSIGLLAESWTVENPTTYVFKLRQGMKFQNKAPAFGREVTTDDWIAAIQRMTKNSVDLIFPFPPNQVTARDKYTLEFKMEKPEYDTLQRLSYLTWVYPKEAVDANDKVDWKNTCGTGPYIFSDYVSATSATLTKNTEYWRMDPLHKNNKLPYLDKIKVLYITDGATRLAALRSGQVDRLGDIGPQDAEDLKASNPNLLQHGGIGNLHVIFMIANQKPFDDIRVRQALHMSIDLKGMQKDFWGGQAALPSSPILSGDWYVPLDKLPPDLAELYSYNTARAKQLLADAGYPNGFETTLMVDTAEGCREEAIMVKNNWDAIGVKTTLDITADGAIFDSKKIARDYKVALFSSGGGADAIVRSKYLPKMVANFFWGDKEGNYTWYDQEIVDKQAAIIAAAADPNKQVSLLIDLNLFISRKVYGIGLPCPYVYTIWNPRIQGYGGAATMGQQLSQEGMWAYVWVTDGK